MSILLHPRAFQLPDRIEIGEELMLLHNTRHSIQEMRNNPYREYSKPAGSWWEAGADNRAFTLTLLFDTAVKLWPATAAGCHPPSSTLPISVRHPPPSILPEEYINNVAAAAFLVMWKTDLVSLEAAFVDGKHHATADLLNGMMYTWYGRQLPAAVDRVELADQLLQPRVQRHH